MVQVNKHLPQVV